MTSLNNIKIIINSIKNKKIGQLKIEQGHTQLTINKTKKQSINTYNNSNTNQRTKKLQNQQKKANKNIEAITRITNNENKTEAKIIDQSLTYSTIISPMVGTFYRSPAPNESAFVEINTIVKTKQTVCIIEAMKLMNEIESEVQGEVVEILVEDGDIVDCGQALMKVKAI